MKRDRVIGLIAVLVLLGSLVFMLGGTSVNGSRTLQATLNYCAPVTASGTTYACNMTPPLLAYTTGACYSFLADVANTGTATINFNSLGATTIKKATGGVTTNIVANDIRATQIVNICYDGTNMQMQSILGNAPSSGANPAGSFSEINARLNGTTFQALTNTAPVPTASWVLHNCGTGGSAGRGTIDDFSAKVISINLAGNTSATQTCIGTQSLGAAPYTAIAQLHVGCGTASANGQAGGLYLYDGTKAYGFVVVCITSEQLALSTNQLATLSTVYPQTGATQFIVGVQLTLKVVDNSTNRIWSYWSNGSWVQFLSEGTATFLTPNAVGFGGLDGAAVVENTEIQLLYWCVASGTTCNGQ